MSETPEERQKRFEAFNDAVAEKLRALWETVLAQYNNIADHALPPEAQVIRVAKAICVANGFEPDMVVMGWANSHGPMMGAKRTALLVHPVHPQWALFIDDARAAIEATKEPSCPTTTSSSSTQPK